MHRPLRILYVGALWHGSTSRQRLKALGHLGHQVVGVDTEPPEVRNASTRLISQISRKLFNLGVDAFGPRDLAGANKAIREKVKAHDWDVLWIDKGLTIEAQTLAEVKSRNPRCVIVGYSPDDMMGRHNQSRQILGHYPLYDMFFTTKSYGVGELKSLGCPRVIFVGNAFDPEIHQPVPVSPADRKTWGGPVGFVGAYETARAVSLHSLAAHGIHVRVWGPGWHKCRLKSRHLLVEQQSLWAEQYALALNAFDINLCFLRKLNRDLQTTRSVEIPACGGFMLAERTDEHLALFEEGKEAEFFSSDEELLDKVRYYLAHDENRRRLAAAGRERCLKSGYSNHERLQEMLQAIEQLPG